MGFRHSLQSIGFECLGFRHRYRVEGSSGLVVCALDHLQCSLYMHLHLHNGML